MKPFVIRMNRRQHKWTCGMDREMFFDEPCAIKRTEIVVVIHSQPVSASNPFPLCYYGSCLVGKPLNHCAIICEAEYVRMMKRNGSRVSKTHKRPSPRSCKFIVINMIILLLWISGRGNQGEREKHTPTPQIVFVAVQWKTWGRANEIGSKDDYDSHSRSWVRK